VGGLGVHKKQDLFSSECVTQTRRRNLALPHCGKVLVIARDLRVFSAEMFFSMPMLQALNSPKVESESRSPLVYSAASAPGNIAGGFNEFLQNLDVTIR
jgi:hypothetical protein